MLAIPNWNVINDTCERRDRVPGLSIALQTTAACRRARRTAKSWPGGSGHPCYATDRDQNVGGTGGVGGISDLRTQAPRDADHRAGAGGFDVRITRIVGVRPHAVRTGS